MSLPKFGPYIDRMTAYCTYCPKMCRFSCPTADAESRETATPWGMMRLLEMAKDGSVELTDEVADAFFHCTGCRRCQSFCEHDNDVPHALWEARRWVVDAGFLPDAYHELYEQFEETGSAWGADADEETEIDASAFDQTASVAFWPDCSTVRDRPEMVGAVGRLLEELLGRKVRLVRSDEFGGRPPCCGFPLTGAGIEDPESCRDKLWPALDGVDRVWTDCPALAAWHEESASWNIETGDDDPEIGHLFGLIADRVGDVEPERRLEVGDELLHESCMVARQLEGLDDVAAILDAICEESPGEMAYRGENSPCCGGRCHYRALEPEAAREASAKVVGALQRHEGAERVVTTSAMCRKSMAEATGDELVTGLLELVCDAYGV